MNYLARREYAVTEMGRKLVQRGHHSSDIEPVLEDLQREGLLSNARYAEARTRSRVEQGYGKLRIDHELQQAGISEELIQRTWQEQAIDWRVQMEKVRRKRFGDALPAEYKEQLRQFRFLQYRGFPLELIRELIGS